MDEGNATERIFPKHIFGDHSLCEKSWCGYLKDPASYRHRELPHGRDLSSKSLQDDLQTVLLQYSSNATQLCQPGSSQRNEALNSTIGSKTPKIRHYGSSFSNDVRVAAAVSQKNIGHSHVSDVCAELDMPPGTYTIKQAESMDKRQGAAAKKSAQPSTKRKRVVRCLIRSQTLADLEVREGPQYSTGMALDNTIDYTQIPDAITRPSLQNIEHINPNQIILFDVETSETGHQAEIIQISASCLKSDDVFAKYILPEGSIHQRITSLTHLSTQLRRGSRVLCHRGEEVPSEAVHPVLEAFFEWTETCKHKLVVEGVVLFAHNCKAFDMRHFITTVTKCEMTDRMHGNIVGFGDTLPMSKAVYDKSQVSGYSLSTLCSEVLNFTYDAHDALKNLCADMVKKVDQVAMYCWTVQSVIEDIQYNKKKTCLLHTLSPLLNHNVISKSFTEKIAGSGLHYDHLKCVVSRDGLDGLRVLLSAKNGNKIRVTAKDNIITSLYDHFTALN